MPDRFLVTGGAGYVGRFVVEGLPAAGCDVTVAGRAAPPTNFFSRRVDFLPFSLEPDAVRAEVLEGFDGLVHAAFHHSPGKYRGGEGDDPAAFRRFNLDGSVALFEAAKAAGVRRCVFLSTRAVYGRQSPGVALSEDMACRPDTLYGEVKLAAEHALAALASPEFVTASLRVTGVYGPAGPGRAHKWSVLFDDFLAGKPIAPRIGTEVHGGDVAAAVQLMLEAESAQVSGKAFNVSDILLDRHDLLALVNEIAGADHPLPERANTGAFNEMSTERIRALGWQPGGLDLMRETVAALVRDRN